ncbi:MAG: hypothetical protein GEV06_29045, partial [Luteitalea sp.]|nr:hypothetical protein [Luteitalea sp.]
MKRTTFSLLAVIGSAAILGAIADPAAQDADLRRHSIPLSAARLIIEYNASGQDVGLQAFVDGEPWTRFQILAPDRRKIFDVRGKGHLGMLGLTELFVESHEPVVPDEL